MIIEVQEVIDGNGNLGTRNFKNNAMITIMRG